jgi:hypothetical protein
MFKLSIISPLNFRLSFVSKPPAPEGGSVLNY